MLAIGVQELYKMASSICLKIGVTQTVLCGVTQTATIGVTHTGKVAQGEYILDNNVK